MAVPFGPVYGYRKKAASYVLVSILLHSMQLIIYEEEVAVMISLYLTSGHIGTQTCGGIHAAALSMYCYASCGF